MVDHYKYEIKIESRLTPEDMTNIGNHEIHDENLIKRMNEDIDNYTSLIKAGLMQLMGLETIRTQSRKDRLIRAFLSHYGHAIKEELSLEPPCSPCSSFRKIEQDGIPFKKPRKEDLVNLLNFANNHSNKLFSTEEEFDPFKPTNLIKGGATIDISSFIIKDRGRKTRIDKKFSRISKVEELEYEELLKEAEKLRDIDFEVKLNNIEIDSKDKERIQKIYDIVNIQYAFEEINQDLKGLSIGSEDIIKDYNFLIEKNERENYPLFKMDEMNQEFLSLRNSRFGRYFSNKSKEIMKMSYKERIELLNQIERNICSLRDSTERKNSSLNEIVKDEREVGIGKEMRMSLENDIIRYMNDALSLEKFREKVQFEKAMPYIKEIKRDTGYVFAGIKITPDRSEEKLFYTLEIYRIEKTNSY